MSETYPWLLRTVGVILTGCRAVDYVSLGGSPARLISKLGDQFTATFALVQRNVRYSREYIDLLMKHLPIAQSIH